MESLRGYPSVVSGFFITDNGNDMFRLADISFVAAYDGRELHTYPVAVGFKNGKQVFITTADAYALQRALLEN